MYFESRSYDVTYVKSNVDNREYLVRNLSDKQMAADLLEEGIYVIGFFFPVVPKNEARIRVQISAGMNLSHLDRAVQAFVKVGKALGVI